MEDLVNGDMKMKKLILSKVENTFTTKKCPQQSLQIILWTNKSNKCLKQKQWEI